MSKNIKPTSFIARMERKYQERKKGYRRVVGMVGEPQEFRFFTKRRRSNRPNRPFERIRHIPTAY